MTEVEHAAGDDKDDEDDFDVERDNFIPIVQQTIDSTKVESNSTGTAESGQDFQEAIKKLTDMSLISQEITIEDDQTQLCREILPSGNH
eukprot:6852062-Ditylum_brightwellii.AAC.1